MYRALDNEDKPSKKKSSGCEGFFKNLCKCVDDEPASKQIDEGKLAAHREEMKKKYSPPPPKPGFFSGWFTSSKQKEEEKKKQREADYWVKHHQIKAKYGLDKGKR